MPADLAAGYCGEKTVEAFRYSVGSLYPQPKNIPGKGKRWLKEDLDRAISSLHGIMSETLDAAEVL